MIRGDPSAIFVNRFLYAGYFRFRNFRICGRATISSPAPSSTSELVSGVVTGNAVRSVVPVKDPRKLTAVVIVSSDVRAKGIVTFGEPNTIVDPKQACVGGAAAVNVQGFAIETDVVPAGPAASVLSLRSHERKASESPTAPWVKVPEFEADRVDGPVGSVKSLTP